MGSCIAIRSQQADYPLEERKTESRKYEESVLKIEELRTTLERMVLLNGVGSQAVLDLSQELDVVLVNFMKNQNSLYTEKVG
ncbi:MAG: aspartyl-phosphate phosphatase Spo0E family protein [Anaerolineaceae bacterium]|nr:aspartyl-phosphate phosphatase Spo0E family protein [Anaerolineaceae bacterium]